MYVRRQTQLLQPDSGYQVCPLRDDYSFGACRFGVKTR